VRGTAFARHGLPFFFPRSANLVQHRYTTDLHLFFSPSLFLKSRTTRLSPFDSFPFLTVENKGASPRADRFFWAWGKNSSSSCFFSPPIHESIRTRTHKFFDSPLLPQEKRYNAVAWFLFFYRGRVRETFRRWPFPPFFFGIRENWFLCSLLFSFCVGLIGSAGILVLVLLLFLLDTTHHR